MRFKFNQVVLLSIGLLSLLAATGCNKEEFFQVAIEPQTYNEGDPLCLNNAAACEIKSRVKKPGVVTILMALGDLVEDQLIVNEEAARLLAQNAISFATPVDRPIILLVRDYNATLEHPYDTDYIHEKLLRFYDVKLINEPKSGLTEQHLAGYDLIWFNNPGHPMSNPASKAVLKNFTGGVILSGDDMANNNQDLTGLKYINNGGGISCNGNFYNFDSHDSTNRYQIELSTKFFPGLPNAVRFFQYANDIDQTTLATSAVEVLATATASAGGCTYDYPVIVRYEK